MDVMIDLETVGKDPGCAVVSIGAAAFCLKQGKVIHTFDAKLDLEAQLKAGLSVDASTIEWWMGQSEEARSMFKKKGVDPKEALGILNRFLTQLGDTKDTYVWGNGSSFDISILEAVYRAFDVKPAWRYSNVMDLRTFRRFKADGRPVPRSKGVHHNALDDAVNQAEYVIGCFKTQGDRT